MLIAKEARIQIKELYKQLIVFQIYARKYKKKIMKQREHRWDQ